MTNTYLHAKRELDILSATTPDAIALGFKDELLALCEKFGKSGQSGGSAPWTAKVLSDIIMPLLLQETVCPVMGTDDEWINVAQEDGLPVYQNNRCHSLFKRGIEGTPYYLDAITWKTQTGSMWSGNAILKTPLSELPPYVEGGPKWMVDSNNMVDIQIRSRQFIQGFPFTPKTFYIDVIEKEVAPDDWEFYIKDAGQLNKVWKYYKQPL